MKHPTMDAARSFVAEAAHRFEVKRRAVELEQMLLGLLRT
jgi:hypothetical protein